MRTFGNEIRYAIRSAINSPLSSLFVVLVLAVGIGVTTAIFSMVDAIVLRPFPFPSLDRIVAISQTGSNASGQRFAVSPANFLDWRNSSQTFEQVAAYQQSTALLMVGVTPEPVQTCLITRGFFSVLGLPIFLGRYLSGDGDDVERNAVVLSYRFWQRRMGADPGVIGKTINLDGLHYNVIGVAANTLDFPIFTDVWVPRIMTPRDKVDRTTQILSVIAKLKDGQSVADAGNEMASIRARLAREYPLTNAGTGAAVLLLRDSVNSYSRALVLMLMGAVIFLLLLSCANVANIQVARILMRRREIAARLCFGARTMDILRQLFVEGVLLALFAAGSALLIAFALLAYIKREATEAVVRNVAGFMSVSIDKRVLAFALFLSLVSTVLFVLPALYQAVRGRVLEALKEEGRGSSAGRGGNQTRSALIITEVILGISLLVGAYLMVDAFNRIATASGGYDPKGVVTFDLDLTQGQASQESEIKERYNQALSHLAAVPGVTSVGMTTVLPSVGDSESSHVVLQGSDARLAGTGPVMEVRVVSEGYFKTMGIPLKSGRSFRANDDIRGQSVAIVSEGAAQTLWRNHLPLGRQIQLTSKGFSNSWLIIVGTVGDVDYFFLDSERRPTVYVPYRQNPARPLTVVMRTTPNLSGLSMAVNSALHPVDATLEVYHITSMLNLLANMSGGVKLVATLMTALALLALVLCASGVHAIMSHSVAQQTREIGIRIAVGAQKRDVLKLVFKFALRRVLIGLAIGIPIALVLAHFLASVLPGVIVVPKLGFAWLGFLLIGVALLASYFPARRATSTDPIDALRSL